MPRNDEAGREMDALIAEQVFGWSWEGRFLTPPHSHRVGAERMASDWTVYSESVLPFYSTDIAAAWLVVEKLSGYVTGREEPWWSVAVFHGQEGQVGCRVYSCAPGFSIFNVEHVVIAEAVGNTAPHAICLAALKVPR